MIKLLAITALLLAMLFGIFCTNPAAPEQGDLIVTVAWDSVPGLDSLSIPHDSLRVRIVLVPDTTVQVFSDFSGSYTIPVELGIYNIHIAVYTLSGDTLYQADTLEVLVEPNTTVSLPLAMVPNFPADEPVFAGLLPANVNNNGDYTLSWNTVPKATGYRLETDDDSLFGSPALLYAGADTAFAVTGQTTGTYYYRVRALNSLGRSPWSARVSFTVEITGSLIINTLALSGGTQGQAYSQSICAAGGKMPYAWEITGGALPAGLDTSSDTCLLITGTPAGQGVFACTVRVTDASVPQKSAAQAYTITIVPSAQPVDILTDSLVTGTQGQAYSQSVCAAGGAAPYQWAIVSGALPAGLDTASGGCFAITGTPLVSGQCTLTIRVTDAQVPPESASTAFPLLINSVTMNITETSLPACTLGVAYRAGLTAAGGSGGRFWSLASGALPAGLTFDSTLANGTAVISGIPSDTGHFSLGVHVTDSLYADVEDSAVFNLDVILPPALGITTASIPACTVGLAYNAVLSAAGGSGKRSWSLLAGALPAGLSFDSSLTNGTAVISGTPADTGAFALTVAAVDSHIANWSDTANLILVSAPRGLSITVDSLATCVRGAPYSQVLTAAGGTGKWSWSLAAGAVPSGLTFDSTLVNGTALISGTSSDSGLFPLTIVVIDSVYRNVKDSLPCTLRVEPPLALVITADSLPTGFSGLAYSANLSASGGSGKRSWSLLSGTLPAGITFDSTLTNGTAAVSGTATDTGTFNITVAAVDSYFLYLADTADFTLRILPRPVNIATTTLPACTALSVCTLQVCAEYGTLPYHWRIVSGALPAGMSLDSTYPNNECVYIAGGTNTPDTVAIDFEVRDEGAPQAADTQTLTLYIDPRPLTIITDSLPSDTFGRPYSQVLDGFGGSGSWTWSQESGTLPPGLTLTDLGINGMAEISGTPADTGTFNFTLKITDDSWAGVTGTKAFSIRIIPAPALSITTDSMPTGTVLTDYAASFEATGGSGLWSWHLVASNLPASLTFNPDYGDYVGGVTGVPGALDTGFYTVTVAVTDTYYVGLTDTAVFNFRVMGLEIVTDTLPPCTTYTPYEAFVRAIRGSVPYHWSVDTLPGGITLDSADANRDSIRIAGEATMPDTLDITLTVEDDQSADKQTRTKVYRLYVHPRPLNITTAPPLPNGSMSAGFYDQTLSASGGSGEWDWSVSSGSLPPGLDLYPLGFTANIQGTPMSAGTYTFTIRVDDIYYANWFDEQEYTIIIDP